MESRELDFDNLKTQFMCGLERQFLSIVEISDVILAHKHESSYPISILRVRGNAAKIFIQKTRFHQKGQKYALL